MSARFLAKFKEIAKEDTPLVGGKGANLGEMTAIGIPVPPGFVVTTQAYRHFLKENKLPQKLHPLLDHLNVNNPTALQDSSRQIKKLLLNSSIPEEISREIISAYLDLEKQIAKSRFRRLMARLGFKDLPVAIRSSATNEDSHAASFAGQNETFLNIIGEANVTDAIRRCWASLFEARSIFYRLQNGFDHFSSAIAVVVQAMVQSEASGVLFSLDPVTNNRNRIIVEAIWGLGEYVVQGKLTPDHYEIDKDDLTIVEKKIAEQKVMLTRSPKGETWQQNVPKAMQFKQKLTDRQIKELAEISRQLEKHYYFPQDSEFAVGGGEIYLVQTRPITTTKSQPTTEKIPERQLESLKVLLTGAPASPGVRSGPVKILKSAKEINRLAPGDILIATQTNPNYVPAMKKAAAIVTDKGGRTSHAAIVSRQLGIPCVVGTEGATKILKNGHIITVNGTQGKVYAGGIRLNTQYEIPNTSSKTEARHPDQAPIKTATKVYVNLAEPQKAKEVAALNCDGVGLLRAEFVLAGIGIHPKQAIAEKRQKEFIDKLTEGLTTFAQAFYPRPVVYRLTDFKTNQYRSLKGGEKYEPQEENPLIGFRGAYRYLTQPDVFKMEIEAIKNVRNKADFKNLWLMIPFCRTVEELEKVKGLIASFGLSRSPSFKLWLMCEIPANVILLDKFIAVGLDGISVGSNDLTMLTLGVDRDNQNVASEYSELDQAMLDSFEKIIKTCQKHKVTCSMCGQAPSDYPELTEKLVEWGITSVSVNPDALDRTREIVSLAEKKLLDKK